MSSPANNEAATRWLFRSHVAGFVCAACLGALGVGGHGWAFAAAALATLFSGACALVGGRTFLTSQATRLSIAARAGNEQDRAAGERAAANWAGVVLIAFGGVVLYLTTR